MKIHRGFWGMILLLFPGCTSPSKVPLPFDFYHPSEIIKLPQSLHEISGITFYRKNELACVQDEKGIVFFYNIKKDKLRSSIDFGKNKDYEGITNVNDTLFVLRSNGVISEIDSTSETGYANEYDTFLSKENNCEGLCYDQQHNRLLVACKGKPKKKTAERHMKAIYSFDLQTRTMDKKPAFIINPDSVEAHLIPLTAGNFFSNFLKRDVEKDFQFEPSELCIDTITQDIYILSSVGKTLLVLNSDGNIKCAIHLDPAIFKQPEGLTFSKDGNIFISDEGREGHANLIRINRIIEE
jgi:uncharacterized protein YjiK